ncbi:hypothetical protein GE21DRAFT_5987 [Neurospora crassa]|uniref:Uncharacterized protein n=1 Tax=Neurospora crassa (strain ATCC 24698 / 74-OR23-1A / CBS 708.71 / DSM 1257 / FGSC 987) TaxID=367110 RepID=Q7RY48_NEUCR|nr:hypothetical protein NCU04515 [Neurospora crassa OR74A]EAA27690.1 hypothetical protein NCU04515 [Neurospora crassa OR74A]KHE79475.1 hypothetical protein GE21DRAFT_5987 [Neurospora crassa]|eukprot:XP_956926.1 hypothetical protein NCU04515 [Neurospora crassa OR74A]
MNRELVSEPIPLIPSYQFCLICISPTHGDTTDGGRLIESTARMRIALMSWAIDVVRPIVPRVTNTSYKSHCRRWSVYGLFAFGAVVGLSFACHPYVQTLGYMAASQLVSTSVERKAML